MRNAIIVLAVLAAAAGCHQRPKPDVRLMAAEKTIQELTKERDGLRDDLSACESERFKSWSIQPGREK
jgi:hypothetical protein